MKLFRRKKLYRGCYIDGDVFKSEQEIDEHWEKVKKRTEENMKRIIELQKQSITKQQQEQEMKMKIDAVVNFLYDKYIKGQSE